MSSLDGLPSDFWLFALLSNICSFAVVVVPAAIIVRHVKKNPHLMAGHAILRVCVQGQDDGQPVDADQQKAEALAEAQAEDAETFPVKVGEL